MRIITRSDDCDIPNFDSIPEVFYACLGGMFDLLGNTPIMSSNRGKKIEKYC